MTEQVPEHQASFLQRLLRALVEAACGYPKTVLTIAALAAAASLYASFTRLEYRTQRSDLISARKDYQQRWQKYLAEFGDDDDIVVVVKGADRKRMEQAIESLAARIKSQPNNFDRLFFNVDLRGLSNRALLFLPVDQIQQIQNNIKSMSMLLEWGPLGWRSLTLARLLHEATQRAAKLTPGQALTSADVQFFTQLSSISHSAAATLDKAGNYQNPWNSLLATPPAQSDLLNQPQYFFSGDASLAFLLTRPIKEKGSFTGAQRSVDAMRRIVDETRLSFGGLEFGLTGLPVLETDEMVAAQRDTRQASWLAIAGVTILFFVVYRSIYYPLLTVSTLLIGTSWAMGWMTLTVGHVNILSATFAVMLIGMGDYGVLWVMRYERERRLGADVETALRRTAVCVGAGTMTAALTTAMAFCAAMLADFQAVAELGWIAGSGVLLCAFSCFTVLPALLKIADRREQQIPATLPHPVTATWLPRLANHSRWVLGSGLALTAILAVCAGRLSYDHNLLHLQASDLDSVKWEQTLIEHTAGASWHAQSYTASPQEALALKARYEKLPEVSRVVEVASLVPADQEKKLEPVGDIQHRLRWLPDARTIIHHDLPHVADIKRELNVLIDRLGPSTANPSLLAKLRVNLNSLNKTLKDRHAVQLQKFEERMAGDLAADLHRLRDVATPRSIQLADLPPALRERYIGSSGKWLLQVFGKDCLWDFQPLEHFAQQIQTVDPNATGKPFGTVEGLRAMKEGFQRAGIYAFIAIILVLLWDFRNLGRTCIALVPLILGIAMALGIMGLFGLPLNPANMIALPLVLGVGVDNGVHMLHDYLARKAEGTGTVSRAIGRGVLVKALTTMIGFGTLMISSERGLAGLGFCLTLGVACCMVTALLMLPAILSIINSRASRSAPGTTSQPRFHKAA